jgi:hypothetical protein
VAVSATVRTGAGGGGVARPGLFVLRAILAAAELVGRLVNYEYNSITTKSYIWHRYAIVEHT